uniref:ELKS/RAB6-interacting/CAST family member 2 n=1 Tax=Neogobius melanostomus TaxID=47308 RepID=A0A8C6TCW3_9GOBI
GYSNKRTLTRLASRSSQKVKQSAGPEKPTTYGSATAPGGKTLSMENIQSLSAAYATTSTLYPSDCHTLEQPGACPKGIMTPGRSSNNTHHYTGRPPASGSSPNIRSSGSPPQSEHYGDQDTYSLQRHSRHPQTLQASNGRGEASTFDLHTQLRDLRRENDHLKKELDGGLEERAGPNTSSTNLWSQEMKQCKGPRREDRMRGSILKDQCRTLPDPYRNHHKELQVTCALQEELRAHREMNSRLKHQPCSPCQMPGCDGFSSPPPLDTPAENYFRLQSEHDRQAKELFMLKKTMEDMEQRIDSQKQTLGARDESIQRLLEMLQGQSQSPWGRGQRTRVISAATQEGEAQLENMHEKEELHRRNQSQVDPVKSRTLQTVIDMKDTKISSLERNLRDLEDEVQMLKTSGLLHPDDRQDDLKQVEVYKSHSKFMKTKIEHLKQELSKKETEMQTLQTKLETLTNQNSDCKQHIEVLKESLTAKEQRANTLQTEVDALRVRLEEKEQFLTKKTKQLQDLSDEKSTLTGEIRDLKDMLEVKERKVIVLQKKIENLLEQLKDKDKQLTGLRERVQGLQTDSSNTDTALATLEEALSEKERVIENLRDQKEREDRMRLEDMELLRKENQELKDKLLVLQPQKLLQKICHLCLSCSKTHSLNGTSRSPDITERLRLLEQEVSRYREESVKSQAEVDRLMVALRDAETDRSFKDRKISDLERKRGYFWPHLNLFICNMLTLSPLCMCALGQLEELMGALEKTREELDATKMRLSTTQQSLHERDGHLSNLRQERRKQLEEILEMKQQALLAAISEKDANIALLEISASNRKKAQEEVLALKREKDRLMHQLKQQVQSHQVHCILALWLTFSGIIHRSKHNKFKPAAEQKGSLVCIRAASWADF